MQVKEQLSFNDFVRCSECHNEEFRTTTNPKTGKPQRVKWTDRCTLCRGDGFLLMKKEAGGKSCQEYLI